MMQDCQLIHLLRCAAADQRVATFYFQDRGSTRRLTLGEILTEAASRIENGCEDDELLQPTSFENFVLQSGMTFLVDKEFTFKGIKFTQGDQLKYTANHNDWCELSHNNSVFLRDLNSALPSLQDTIHDMLNSGHITLLN